MPHLFYWLQMNWFVVVLLILVVITVASLTPLTQLQKMSVPGSDKTHHFIAYAILMFPVALRRPAYWVCWGIAFIGYSGLIELLQPYVNRSNEWLDLLANSCGVTLGAILGVFLDARFKRIENA